MPTLRERSGGEKRLQPPRAATLAVPGLPQDLRRAGPSRGVAPAKRASALAHYLAGVGLRATERLVGGSHNAVMNWGLEAVAGKALAHVKPDEVEWVEADELWTYVGQKKRPAGCGGRLIVLPRKSGLDAGRSWNRNGPLPGCAASSRRPHHLPHRLLAPRWPDLCPSPSSARQGPHLHHRKP